jgi:hypothetical protein
MCVSGFSERTPVAQAYSIALCKIIRLRVAVDAVALHPVLVWVIRVSSPGRADSGWQDFLNASIRTVWPVSQAIAGWSWSGGSGLSRIRVLYVQRNAARRSSLDGWSGPFINASVASADRCRDLSGRTV